MLIENVSVKKAEAKKEWTNKSATVVTIMLKLYTLILSPYIFLFTQSSFMNKSEMKITKIAKRIVYYVHVNSYFIFVVTAVVHAPILT